jgi:hypothetical protein
METTQQPDPFSGPRRRSNDERRDDQRRDPRRWLASSSRLLDADAYIAALGRGGAQRMAIAIEER